jgi:hypothetical protein
MTEGEPLSIVAIFDKGFTDSDLDAARSGLIELGLNCLYLMTSMPPKLSVALSPDADQKRIDEVVGFLNGIDHVEGVRVGYPSWQEEP